MLLHQTVAQFVVFYLFYLTHTHTHPHRFVFFFLTHTPTPGAQAPATGRVPAAVRRPARLPGGRHAGALPRGAAAAAPAGAGAAAGGGRAAQPAGRRAGGPDGALGGHAATRHRGERGVPPGRGVRRLRERLSPPRGLLQRFLFLWIRIM